MLLPNPTHGHQVTAGESETRMADKQHGMSILCKWVRRLPQHALTTCYCSSCSLQPHLDWLYSSDVHAQPSTAKGNWHAPRERRDY